MTQEQAKVRGFSTKYALTTGIEEVDIDVSYSQSGEACTFPGYESLTKYVYTVPPPRGVRVQLVTGKTFFLTREEAVQDQKKQAEAKIKSLKKQIAKLERLA